MNLKSVNKKILYLAMILLILAGIVVVALKGFKVDLMLERHESVNFLIGKDFSVREVKDICKEVFGGKYTVVRKVEIFSDTVNINASTITDEEKEKLVSKMNEKFGTTIEAGNLAVKTTPNVRIRDMVRPYIVPVMITIIIIAAYIVIKFRNMNMAKLLVKLIAILVLSEAMVSSLVAIMRIPFSGLVVNLMAVLAIIEVIAYINSLEKKAASLEQK